MNSDFWDSSSLRFHSRQVALRTCALRLRRCVTAAAYSQQYGYLDSHSAWLSCVHALRSWLPCCECRRARVCARVCCMCNLAPAPSVTRIKLWSSRSRHDMTPAQRRLQKNGHNVGAIGACAMTWSGMPLSRGSGHFCTCGERRAASTVMLMMLVGAGLTNNIIMCVLGAYLECNDSYLACRFMWRTGAGTLRLRCVMGGRYRHGDAAKR